jgi:hypothetical protein
VISRKHGSEGAAAQQCAVATRRGRSNASPLPDDILRHGAMPLLFGGTRAPSTLGTFLRAFTHGHALQLHALHRRFLAALGAYTLLLPGASEKAFIDVDSTHKRVYGRAKQGAEYGRFKGIRTLHPLLATICTPHSRPVIATVRMRRGKAADSRGAPKFVSEALATAVEAGCTGLRILRADSQFYNAGVIAACRRADARFSITCGMNASIKRAIAAVPDTAWQQITYPTAVPDPETGELIFDAEVAEIPAYTAFASRRKSERVTARLIVRRVRDLAKPATVGEQGELFPPLALPPVLHRQPRAGPYGRAGAPSPRRRRAGHCRQQSLRPGPPALRALQRQRRLDHPVGDGLQPAPRHRRADFRLPHQGHHRHPPRPTGRRSRPDRPLSPPRHPAPTAQLAMAARLETPLRHGPRPARTGLTAPAHPAREGPTRTETWKSWADSEDVSGFSDGPDSWADGRLRTVLRWIRRSARRSH